MTRLFTVLLTAIFLSSCAGSSTVTVGGRPVSIPKKAADEHEKLIENVGIYDDPKLNTYVNEIAQRLVANSSLAGDEFTFTLLDSPDINAFALPGGMIYINRGLLATSTLKQNSQALLHTRLPILQSGTTHEDAPNSLRRRPSQFPL